MRIVSATTDATCPIQALQELGLRVMPADHVGQAPDFVALHGIADLVEHRFHTTARGRFPAALHGGTSCMGVLGTGWTGGDTLPTSGVFAIFDPAGSYGTASCDLGQDPAATAAILMTRALVNAGRPGEAPDLIILTMAPGQERAVMQGIRSVVGSGTPIVGGSSADNGTDGHWAQFSGDGFHRQGMVISALFPSGTLGHSYQTGFVPVGPNGIVTAVSGRRIMEIDNRPATQVYSDWTGGTIPAPALQDASRSILEESSLMPLGRVKSHLNSVPIHLLLLPAKADGDGGLHMMSDIEVGERIWQMTGSVDNLVAHAGRVARYATAGLDRVHGSIVICCAGCVIGVGDRIPEVAGQIDAALGGAPYLALFTYGEQGTVSDGQSEHGNLMFSCAAFGSDA